MDIIEYEFQNANEGEPRRSLAAFPATEEGLRRAKGLCLSDNPEDMPIDYNTRDRSRYPLKNMRRVVKIVYQTRRRQCGHVWEWDEEGARPLEPCDHYPYTPHLDIKEK